VNNKALIALIANMNRRPTPKEWAKMHQQAKELTRQNVVDLIMDDVYASRGTFRFHGLGKS